MVVAVLFAVLYVTLLVLPAWLCAKMRYWHAWTVYAVLTILLIIPFSVTSIQCFTKTICDLGDGLVMLWAGSLPLTWLIGSLLGLPFRFLRKPPQSN